MKEQSSDAEVSIFKPVTPEEAARTVDLIKQDIKSRHQKYQEIQSRFRRQRAHYRIGNYDQLNPPILTTPKERAEIFAQSRQAAGDASAAEPGTLAEKIHETTLKLGVFRP